MSEKQAIWTPDGLISLGGKKSERVELRSGVMEWYKK